MKELTKKKQKKKLKMNEGITLIALVITIIVLLILASVSIAMLTGQNGILTQAQKAKEETDKASVIEQAQTDILGIQAGGDTTLTQKQLKDILSKYFDPVPDDVSTDDTLTTKEEYGGKYQIAVSDIYNGEIEPEKEMISKTESYVGYYADIDGNGSVDGIIYADLAVGGSGHWPDGDDWGTYEIPKVTTGLKEYSINETGYAGPFGTKDVLKAEGSGEPRFYVMALNDIDDQTHYWYYNAYGNLDNPVNESTNDFGDGKTNTEAMISKWNNSDYGAQNSDDMWGLIQTQAKNGWFVPSKSEWAAFGGELGITISNYSGYGLNHWYCSSSQYNTNSAFTADFNNGCINFNTVNTNGYVRLSTTF